MTTQAMTVEQAIAEAVRREPTKGFNRLLRDIRAQGFRIGNQAGRDVIAFNRLAIARAEREAASLFTRRPSLSRQGGFFIPTEAEAQQFTKGRFERAIRENLKRREVFTLREGRTNRLSTFSFVRVSWSSNTTFDVYIGGDLYDTFTLPFSGQIVQPVGGFTEELLTERIAEQIRGQASINVGSVLGFPPSSAIQGLVISIRDYGIRIGEIQGRG